MTIANDIQNLSPSAVLEMFSLDLTSIGGTVLNFHPGLNEIKSSIIWQAVTYTPMPMKIEDMALNSSGQLPRPKVTISNVLGVIGAYCKTFDDLIGAKITRKRTFAKYLDAVNFVGGVNPTADPNVYFPDDIFFVDRKVTENRLVVQFELASAMDLEGIALPRRQFIQNVCGWRYRSAECGYAGGAVATLSDLPTTNINLDNCGLRLASCKLRFGAYSPLPFGGFPAVGLIR